MSNCINDIIHQYKQKVSCADIILAASEMIPDTSHPSLPLPSLQETLLKMTYLFRIGFLEDMVLALQFYACKQQIEKAVLELERKHYVISTISSEFGKCLVLTKEALFFFYYHPNHTNPRKKINEVTIKDDTLPSEDSLIKYKCISAFACFTIFETQLKNSVTQFKNQTKETKQHYGKEQYVRHIIYKEYLSLPEIKKKELLSNLAFQKEIIDKYSSIHLYSKTFAIEFSDAYLKNDFSKNNLDSNARYQVFRSTINQLFKQNHSQQALFHFLKDFINLHTKPELNEVIPFLLLQCHNLYRGNDIRMRNQLLKTGTLKIRNESKLYILKEHKKILTNRRKVLVRSGAEKNSQETELLETMSQLKQIDNTIVTLEDEIKLLSHSFLFLLYKGEKENGALEFFEKQLDFNTLKESNIYIGIKDNEIIFYILTSHKVALSHIELFQRLERAYKIYQCLFPLHLPLFVVITYGKERQKETEMALLKTKSSFQEIQDYRRLAVYLDTNLRVIDIEHHPTERFEFYQSFNNN